MVRPEKGAEKEKLADGKKGVNRIRKQETEGNNRMIVNE